MLNKIPPSPCTSRPNLVRWRNIALAKAPTERPARKITVGGTIKRIAIDFFFNKKKGKKSENIFLLFLYRAIVLLIFYRWLNSFGTDWFVFDLVCIFMTVFLFKNFYKMRTEIETLQLLKIYLS